MARSWPLMARRGPLINEEAVAAFEKTLGERLPEDYRVFLLEVNGGRLDVKNRQYLDLFVVNSMFSVADPDEARRLEGRRPFTADVPSDDLLYLAYDDGGARVYLVVRGGHRAEVWFHNRSRPERAKPRVLWHERRDMKKLAESFDAFLSRLGSSER